MTAVMASSSLLRIVRENQLIDEAKLQECLRTLSPSVLNGEDALPIADALVESKLLTRFQSNLLLQGKSKSLRITSKYRLLDRLGAGGMGLVYLCEHIRMKRLVALKVLPNSQAKEAGNLERFYREAQAVAALKHPNIVQAYDVDTDNGIHYLVMEYIDGINMEKLVADRGALDPIRAAHYIAQSAEGLQHAAERGLVHRDIKPSNLLIDREGYVKILDMGLARFFDARTDNITERFDNNAVIGTADFISPEQALNSHEVDIRADIYSLGCTFYFLLAGRAPYHDANITQKLLLHQIRDPVAIEQIVPGIDPGIVAIVAKMMAKKPEDRYQTPSEVVADLAPWTEETIAPPGPNELAHNAHVGDFDRASGILTSPVTSSLPKRAPRPGRGMNTQRMTESAIRRIDGLAKEDAEDAPASKIRWVVAGCLLITAAFAGTVLIVVKPWEDSRPAASRKNASDLAIDADLAAPLPRPDQLPKDPNSPPSPKPRLAKLGSGFVQVKLDSNAERPSAENGDIRSQPTDVLFFSGTELRKNSLDETTMLEALRKKAIGGKGGLGGPNAPIIPFAIAVETVQSVPNTLVSVHDKDGLRPLSLNGKEYLISKNFVGAGPDVNVLVRESSTLPKGLTTINALVSELWDISAAEGGSTLKLNSGAVLFMSTTTPRSYILGAGDHPLVVDFNGRTGYFTLSSEQDFDSLPGGREYLIRAQMKNFGENPLVISGLNGNFLRLDHDRNENSRLVAQGIDLGVPNKPFRVVFSTDANLGVPKGQVTLNYAVLALLPAKAVEVDRPLTVIRQGELAAYDPKGEIRWAGKISGQKLGVWGAGRVVLMNRDNDYGGGTEIWGSTIVLQAEGGTPAGTGIVTVHGNGLLTGTGTILKQLHVKAGGVLQPGSEDGKSMLCNGPLFFERAFPNNPKDDERNAIMRFRLPSADFKPFIYSGPPSFDLAYADLEVSLTGGFKPTKDSKCFLIVNRPGAAIQNTFKNLPAHGTVKTTDGKWSAKISYQGSSGQDNIDGGADVVLYDFASVK